MPNTNETQFAVRDFIQDIINRESSMPANCQRQYPKTVLAQLKGAARDSINGGGGGKNQTISHEDCV